MEQFKTLSDKLINFYAHRFFIEQQKLSWAVVYIDFDDQSRKAAVLKIADSNYYIDIERDSFAHVISEDDDLVSFTMVDAWFDEANKNLRHGWDSGKIVTVDLDLRSYNNLHKYEIPFDYDLQYTAKANDQIYSLDFFAYRTQINRSLLNWGVAENANGGYLPVLTIEGHKIALDIERGCWIVNFSCSPHSATMEGHTLQFTNSKGEKSVCDLDRLCTMAEYQYYEELKVGNLLNA